MYNVLTAQMRHLDGGVGGWGVPEGVATTLNKIIRPYTYFRMHIER